MPLPATVAQRRARPQRTATTDCGKEEAQKRFEVNKEDDGDVDSTTLSPSLPLR